MNELIWRVYWWLARYTRGHADGRHLAYHELAENPNGSCPICADEYPSS